MRKTFWYTFDRRHFWVLLKATASVARGKKFTLTMVTADDGEK